MIIEKLRVVQYRQSIRSTSCLQGLRRQIIILHLECTNAIEFPVVSFSVSNENEF